MLLRRCCRILVAAACTALAASRFDLDAAGKVARVTDAQISPDGKSVVAVVSRANYEDNRYDAQLVLVDVASRGQRPLTHNRRVNTPRWSPDGASLAFLSPVDGKPQIFVLPMAGGEARQITESASGVQQYSWGPDGASLAFITQDKTASVSGLERHNKSFEIANNDFLATSKRSPAHLWVAPANGGPARRLTSGDWTLPQALPPSSPSSPASWSPDGRRIALVKVPTPYSGDGQKSAVQLLDVETGALRGLTGRSQRESQPQFSPDGRSIAYWYPRDGEPQNVNEIYVASADGGEGRSVTRGLDRNVMRSIWMADGQSLLVSANDGATVGLWVQPLEGPARRLQLGKVVPSASFWLDASLSRHGQLAFAGSEPNWPAELYLLPSLDAQPLRLTEFNRSTAMLALGRTETIVWEGADGFRQNGILTYPPDFAPGRKYPLVLYIHGGPRSASKEAFSARAQLMAAEGWVVFEPNYRGSDNLGNAFQAAIWKDAGAGPGRDVMSGLEAVKRRGFVDEARIAVSGWSYGGFMTTWMLGNYPEVWRAAVAGAAVTDLVDQYSLSDSNSSRASSYGPSPWTDPKNMESYRLQSPISYAHRIKAPTLILSLTGDYRVTVTQSYKLYHALRDNNVPTRFVGYPLPGHSPTDPVHSRDVDRRWLDWFRQHLGASGSRSE